MKQMLYNVAGLLMLALTAFLPVFAGCSATTPCPELAAFTGGLKPLDEAMYTQHQTVIQDASDLGTAIDQADQGGQVISPAAVAQAARKARRTPVDVNIVATEIQEARSVYQRAATTTQPGG